MTLSAIISRVLHVQRAPQALTLNDYLHLCTMTPFSALLAQRRRHADTVTYDVPEDWAQGRTIFGGVQSALAVQAMKDVVAGPWPADVGLRALQTNFIGPVAPGAFAVRVRTLREGKNIRQVQGVIEQNGQVVASALGVFGQAKPSQIQERRLEQSAIRRDVAGALEMPFIPGLSPSFTQHVKQRWARGAFPYTGTESWDLSLYLRLADEHAQALPIDLLTVLLADAAPTPALAQLKQPAPASTVAWALEILPVDKSFRSSDKEWWRLDKSNPAFASGYANEQGHLWTPDGQLAALGYQIVAVYG